MSRQLTPTVERLAKIWWSFTWRRMVYGMIGFGILVLPWVVMLAAAEAPVQEVNNLVTVAGIVISIVASIEAMHRVLSVEWMDFRLVWSRVLEDRGNGLIAEERDVERTRWHSIQIWWSYEWRSIVMVVLSVVIASMLIPVGGLVAVWLWSVAMIPLDVFVLRMAIGRTWYGQQLRIDSV